MAFRPSCLIVLVLSCLCYIFYRVTHRITLFVIHFICVMVGKNRTPPTGAKKPGKSPILPNVASMLDATQECEVVLTDPIIEALAKVDALESQVVSLRNEIKSITETLNKFRPLVHLSEGPNPDEHTDLSSASALLNVIAHEVDQRIRRANNAVIFNVPDNMPLTKVLRMLLNACNLPLDCCSATRLRKIPGRSCPILIKFGRYELAKQFISARLTIKQRANLGPILIKPDKTPLERSILPTTVTPSKCAIPATKLMAKTITAPPAACPQISCNVDMDLSEQGDPVGRLPPNYAGSNRNTTKYPTSTAPLNASAHIIRNSEPPLSASDVCDTDSEIPSLAFLSSNDSPITGAGNSKRAPFHSSTAYMNTDEGSLTHMSPWLTATMSPKYRSTKKATKQPTSTAAPLSASANIKKSSQLPLHTSDTCDTDFEIPSLAFLSSSDLRITGAGDTTRAPIHPSTAHMFADEGGSSRISPRPASTPRQCNKATVAKRTAITVPNIALEPNASSFQAMRFDTLKSSLLRRSPPTALTSTAKRFLPNNKKHAVLSTSKTESTNSAEAKKRPAFCGSDMSDTDLEPSCAGFSSHNGLSASGARGSLRPIADKVPTYSNPHQSWSKPMSARTPDTSRRHNEATLDKRAELTKAYSLPLPKQPRFQTRRWNSVKPSTLRSGPPSATAITATTFSHTRGKGYLLDAPSPIVQAQAHNYHNPIASSHVHINQMYSGDTAALHLPYRRPHETRTPYTIESPITPAQNTAPFLWNTVGYGPPFQTRPEQVPALYHLTRFLDMIQLAPSSMCHTLGQHL